MIDLSIIILSYNTKNLLDACLNSVFSTTKDLSWEAVVVDNASSDDSWEMVGKKYPRAILIKSKKNLGYSGGNNLGIKKAQGKYVLLLNSDTEVIDNSLKIMTDVLGKHREVGILGPRLVYPDGKVQRSVGRFYSLLNVVIMLCGGERWGLLRSSPDKSSIVDWVSGACFLVKKEVFDKIGILDENLFMYMEEVEFCYRARNYGILTAFTPGAKVIHKGLGSSITGREDAILNIYQGLLYFYKKYYPDWQLKILKLLLKTKAVLAVLIGLITRSSYLKTTYVKAFRLVK